MFSSRLGKIVRIALGLSLVGVVIYWVQREMDWRAALVHIRNTDFVWFTVALLAILTNNLIKALRWRLLFPADQSPPAPGEAFGAMMSGQLLNFFLPLRSGDVSRAYWMGRQRQASTAIAAGTIGAEKIIDLIVMGCLFAVVVASFVLPAWLDTGPVAVLLQLAIGLAIWLGLLLAVPTIQAGLIAAAERWPRLASSANSLVRVLHGFSTLRQGKRMPQLWGLTLLAWLAAIAATYAMLIAQQLPATVLIAILVMVIVQGGLSIPIVPGHLGLFEALAIVALAVVGVAAEQALAFGLMLHMAVLAIPLLVGLPWLVHRLQGTS